MNELVVLLLIIVGLVISIAIFFDLDQKLTKKVENRSGQLIVIEGIEGSGKSQLIELMKEKFPSEWAYTKEPYLLTESNKSDWSKENIHADRETHVEKKILPLLQQNRVLVTNRYWMSGCVYDGWEVEAYMQLWPEPDLVIWLDHEPSEANAQAARVTVPVLQEMRKRYEETFAKIYDSNKHLRIVKINTDSLSSNEVFEQVAAEINKIIQFNEREIEQMTWNPQMSAA